MPTQTLPQKNTKLPKSFVPDPPQSVFPPAPTPSPAPTATAGLPTSFTPDPAPVPEKPGFVKGVIQDVARGPLRLVSNLRAGVDIAMAPGRGAELQKNIDEINNREYDYGFLGKAKPVTTPGQAIGVGLDIGSNFVGGTGAGAVVKQGLKGALIQGAKQGLKYGALTGVMGGGGRALAEDKPIGEVVTDAAVGGAVGAGVGAGAGVLLPAAGKLTRGAANKVREFVDPIFKNKKLVDEAIEITAPVFNKKDRISSFENAGLPGGVQKKGEFGTYKPAPTKQDVEVAKSVSNLVSKSKGPIDNIVAINGEIKNVSENQITPLLQNNPSIFNLKTLDARLKAVPKPDFIKGDPVLDKTYDLVRQRMLDVVGRGKKDMFGLWEARKEFDALAEAQLKDLSPESAQASVIKKAVLDTRRAVNDFIAENTPRGDASFKDLMRRLSNMYEARGNIAEQNQALLNKNAIQRWIKQNPRSAEILGDIGGLVGLGGVGSLILKN